MRIYLDGNGRRRAPDGPDPVEPTPDIPYPNAWMLGQSRTEKILRDKLAEYGVRVELDTAIVGFTQTDDAVTAELSTGETVEAEYLVGADGGRSFVRKHLGIAFEGTTDESIRMLLGDVTADGLDHEYGYWFARRPRTRWRGSRLTPLSGGDQFQFGAPLDDDTSTRRSRLCSNASTSTPARAWPSFVI